MENAVALPAALEQSDNSLVAVFERERRGLRRFIRSRVPTEFDAEDILQEVLYEFVEAYRLMKPIAHAGAWMFQVARSRIADLFRSKKPAESIEDESLRLLELLPSPDAGPDAAYARRVLMEEIEAALDELPAAQREVFIGHEIEGRSYQEMSDASGVGVATLLSRKHYAVRHLRRRLRAIYEETESEKEKGR